MEIERKVPGKKIKVFWVEILLSSCSLVKLQKNDKNFQSIFLVGVVPYTRWGAMLWNMAKI